MLLRTSYGFTKLIFELFSFFSLQVSVLKIYNSIENEIKLDCELIKYVFLKPVKMEIWFY